MGMAASDRLSIGIASLGDSMGGTPRFNQVMKNYKQHKKRVTSPVPVARAECSKRIDAL
jgi:hypothetical protein